MNDGLPLISAAHPRQAWYKRLWWYIWLRWRVPVLSEASLEQICIQIKEEQDNA